MDEVQLGVRMLAGTQTHNAALWERGSSAKRRSERDGTAQKKVRADKIALGIASECANLRNCRSAQAEQAGRSQLRGGCGITSGIGVVGGASFTRCPSSGSYNCGVLAATIRPVALVRH